MITGLAQVGSGQHHGTSLTIALYTSECAFVARGRSRPGGRRDLSMTDDLDEQQAKMREYAEAGAGLGWLIDPYRRRVYVYRPGVEVVVLEDPVRLSGDSVLPGFVLELDAIW